MGASRDTADIWWLFWNRGLEDIVNRKVWKSSYFWKDSFLRYWNRWVGCHLFGHELSNIEKDDDTYSLYCWKCQQYIESILLSKSVIKCGCGTPMKIHKYKMVKGYSHKVDHLICPTCNGQTQIKCTMEQYQSKEKLRDSSIKSSRVRTREQDILMRDFSGIRLTLAASRLSNHKEN
jgi:hypothetical protein